MNNYRTSILQWAEQGRIEAGRVEEAMRVSGALPDKADWHSFIDRLLLWSGTVLLAAGTIFFFAYNWRELGNFARFEVGVRPWIMVFDANCIPMPCSILRVTEKQKRRPTRMAKKEKTPRHSPLAQSVTQDGKTDVKMPNKTTLKAMGDAEEGRDLIQCEDSDDMFKNWNLTMINPRYFI